MSAYVYREVVKQAEQLAPAEQLDLMENLAGMLNKQFASLKNVETTIQQIEAELKTLQNAIGQAEEKTPERLHSITELRGLGKEIWQGIDVDAYLNDERNSWDR